MMILRNSILTTMIAGALGTLTATAATPTTLTVHMHSQNGSNETGTAVLTQTPEGLQVFVKLSTASAPYGVPQPTHIHDGTCANLNPAPKYPLTNTVNGRGTTLLKDVTLSQLLAGKYAINVHKSANDIQTYVSCGNITTNG